MGGSSALPSHFFSGLRAQPPAGIDAAYDALEACKAAPWVNSFFDAAVRDPDFVARYLKAAEEHAAHEAASRRRVGGGGGVTLSREMGYHSLGHSVPAARASLAIATSAAAVLPPAAVAVVAAVAMVRAPAVAIPEVRAGPAPRVSSAGHTPSARRRDNTY